MKTICLKLQMRIMEEHLKGFHSHASFQTIMVKKINNKLDI